MTLKPDTAIRLRNGMRETVARRDLRPRDVIEVTTGGRLPVDGQLLSPSTSFSESALIGEPIPMEHQAGERVAAGATSIDHLMQLTVISEPGDSAIDRILKLIEKAEERRTPVEHFIDRFSRIYTPAIMVAALLVAIIPPLFFASAWLPWTYKELTLLLIDCPRALVTSTPAAITSSLTVATRRGTLIRGSATLEQLGQVRQAAFDKTGTLTVGQPQVTSVIVTAEVDDSALLALAATVEQGSSHPLAQAIVRETQRRQLSIPLADNQRALAGSGIEVEVSGSRILICAASRAAPAEHEAQIQQLESTGQTVALAIHGEALLGILALRSTLRDDTRQTMDALHQLGVQGVVLIGDSPRAAAAITSELRLEFHAGLLPADKVKTIMALNAGTPLAMVGDGINDAPAMKAATIGIAMGSGADVALETAGTALTHNRLTGLAQMIPLARTTHASIRQNIAIALGLKGILPVTTLLGLTGLWLAALADAGTTVLVTANAPRLLHKKLQHRYRLPCSRCAQQGYDSGPSTNPDKALRAAIQDIPCSRCAQQGYGSGPSAGSDKALRAVIQDIPCSHCAQQGYGSRPSGNPDRALRAAIRGIPCSRCAQQGYGSRLSGSPDEALRAAIRGISCSCCAQQGYDSGSSGSPDKALRAAIREKLSGFRGSDSGTAGLRFPRPPAHTP